MSSLSPRCECQKYIEVESVEDLCRNEMVASAPANAILQLKYDGIWARVEIKNNKANVFSKTGQLKHSFQLNSSLFGRFYTLIGEFMYGSQWSQKNDRQGKLYIFDCVMASGEDLRRADYAKRYRKAVSLVQELGDPFRLVPCYHFSKLGELWINIETKQSHEGLIARSWTQKYDDKLLKLKREVEDDFVIMGQIEGEGKHAGRMGALLLGQYNEEGVLEHVGDVGGGFSDSQREWFHKMREQVKGQVALIRGKSRFDSGALRHPQFVKLRDDKTPSQCILKRS